MISHVIPDVRPVYKLRPFFILVHSLSLHFLWPFLMYSTTYLLLASMADKRVRGSARWDNLLRSNVEVVAHEQYMTFSFTNSKLLDQSKLFYPFMTFSFTNSKPLDQSKLSYPIVTFSSIPLFYHLSISILQFWIHLWDFCQPLSHLRPHCLYTHLSVKYFKKMI